MNELPEELQEQALGPALVGWAGYHPVDALAWAAANGVDINEVKSFTAFGPGGGASWQTLLSTAFQSDRGKTLAWLREQPASPERDRMLTEGIFNRTREENLQVYAELTPGGQAESVARLFDSLSYGGAGGDGGSELEPWVEDLPPGVAKQSAIRALSASQAKKTPERIDAIADGWPAGPERDAAMRGIVTSLSPKDPRRALEFARRVTGHADRERSFENVAQQWLSQDETAARAWIASARELSPEQKRVLLRQADDR